MKKCVSTIGLKHLYVYGQLETTKNKSASGDADFLIKTYAMLIKKRRTELLKSSVKLQKVM